VTGVVITTRPGVARVLKTTKIGDVTVNRGETVYLLTYLGEGFHKVWRKGRTYESDLAQDNKSFRIVSNPVSVWWVKIKNRRSIVYFHRKCIYL
jgi:hypothetical protein